MLIKSLLRSFRHATNGLQYALRHERNFQIELALGCFAFALSLLFPLTALERLMVYGIIALVLTLELINTAFERMLDMMKPHIHPYVKVIKDLVAGAVLIIACLALLVGLSIFLPYWV